MTAPPGLAPTTVDQPAVCNKQDAYLAHLVRDARALDPALRDVPKTKLLRMAREFADARAADRRNLSAHAEAVAAGGFADVRAVVLAEFRAWFMGRGDVMVTHSKPVAHDPGKHDWRTHS